VTASFSKSTEVEKTSAIDDDLDDDEEDAQVFASKEAQI